MLQLEIANVNVRVLSCTNVRKIGRLWPASLSYVPVNFICLTTVGSPIQPIIYSRSETLSRHIKYTVDFFIRSRYDELDALWQRIHFRPVPNNARKCCTICKKSAAEEIAKKSISDICRLFCSLFSALLRVAPHFPRLEKRNTSIGSKPNTALSLFLSSFLRVKGIRLRFHPDISSRRGRIYARISTFHGVIILQIKIQPT